MIYLPAQASGLSRSNLAKLRALACLETIFTHTGRLGDEEPKRNFSESEEVNSGMNEVSKLHGWIDNTELK